MGTQYEITCAIQAMNELHPEMILSGSMMNIEIV